MKQKILMIGLCGVFLMSLTGCGTKKDDNKVANNNSTDEVKKDSSKEDSKIFKYMEEIKITNTAEEINEIVGFEGELEEKESYNKYTWKISDDTSLTAIYYSSGSDCNLKIEFDDDLIKNSKVDFSKYDEIKSALNSTSLTYEEFVSKVGNVDGTLVEKGSISKSYRWVNSDGGYLKATFSTSTGKCTFISGRF